MPFSYFSSFTVHKPKNIFPHFRGCHAKLDTYLKTPGLNKQEFLKLLDKYLNHTATEDEIRMLMSYYQSFQDADEWHEEELGSSTALEMKMLDRLKASLNENEPTNVYPLRRRRWSHVAAAAAVVVGLLSATTWLISNYDRQNQTAADVDLTDQINIPSGNKVTLTLNTGQIIVLDSVGNGVVAHAGNMLIRKKDSVLTYESSAVNNDAYASPVAYHTITVAKGSQYQLILPDKSRVWLNTASSLRFPSAFDATERKVEVSGEAYFEVTKDKNKPFRVDILAAHTTGSKRATVEVLGTQFNINAYDDEEMMKTTLLEGSVKIITDGDDKDAATGSHILTPGQQALLVNRNMEKSRLKIQSANIEEVMAWRSSLFNFNNADIETIMREIARWYNVEVVYEQKSGRRNFSGKINRNMRLANVLKILEQSNIHFKVKGNTVIVRT